MGVITSAAITGAAGFVGAHLARGFGDRGVRVLSLVRKLESHSPTGAVEIETALGDPARLEGVDVVVHSAAVRHRHGVDAATYRVSNVDLVERVIRAAGAARVPRFVFISSVGVYGFPALLPVTEAHPYAPRTLYSVTKVEAEARARSVASEVGVELCIVRPTIVYGPDDRNGMLDKLAAMIRSGTYRVVGSGANILHHTHVEDIVEGVWLASTRAEAASEDFILAGPETTTLGRLSRLVARAVGKPLPRIHVPLALARATATMIDTAARRGLAFTSREPPVSHEKLDVMTLPIRFDVAKARRLLGYAPRVGYEEGVRRTLHTEPLSVARPGVAR
jgi:nucleoside-diphosphate-sugar epimerase